MTVTETSSKSSKYTGDDVVSEFAFNFKVLDDEDLVVYKYLISDATSEVLVKDVDYTVDLVDDGDSGGSVTLVSGALSSLYKLQIFRDTPDDQEVSLPDQGNFVPSVINDALDKMTMLIQEMQEVVDRAVVVEPMSEETPEDLITNTALALSTAQSALSVANAATSAAAQSYIDSVAYVNSAIASLLPSVGLTITPWETDISAGETDIATPYSFTAGQVNVGGAWYVLNEAGTGGASLDNTGANTIIILDEAVVVDMDVLLNVFS